MIYSLYVAYVELSSRNPYLKLSKNVIKLNDLKKNICFFSFLSLLNGVKFTKERLN